MNEVYVIGKVVDKITYDFINPLKYNRRKKKEVSVAKGKIELQNGTLLQIMAFNEMADTIYHNVKEKSSIVIRGELLTDMSIEIKQMIILEKRRGEYT